MKPDSYKGFFVNFIFCYFKLCTVVIFRVTFLKYFLIGIHSRNAGEPLRGMG